MVIVILALAGILFLLSLFLIVLGFTKRWFVAGEAFKELEEHQDLEKALDKIAELQAKVIDAREKGEITSQARARAINDALDEFAARTRGRRVVTRGRMSLQDRIRYPSVRHRSNAIDSPAAPVPHPAGRWTALCRRREPRRHVL